MAGGVEITVAYRDRNQKRQRVNFSDLGKAKAETQRVATSDMRIFVSGSSLRFGIDSTGLTVGQLGEFTAAGFSSFGLDSSGYLTAVSEPSSWTLLAIGLTVVVTLRRRRDL